METYQNQCGQLNHLLVQAFHTLVSQDQQKQHGEIGSDDQRKKVKKKKKKKDKEKHGEKQVENGKHGTKKDSSKKDKKKSHKHEDNIKKEKSKDSKNKEVKSDSHYSSHEKSSSYNKYNDDKYYDDRYYKNDYHHSSDKYSYKNKYSDESYYYGSYYEDDRPSRSHKSNYDYSYSSNYRSRSRSPFSKGSRHSDGTSVRSKSSERTRRKHKKEKREKVDKVKLLEIARENLAKMIEKGDLPKGTDINKLKLRHLRELTTQKSVQQWTEFCKAISQLESVVCSDDSDVDPDSEEDDKSIKSDYLFPIRHPFKLKEKKDIEIKVRDFVNLKCRSASELAVGLRQQFPVSSGNQHRRKEDEWIQVEPLALPAPAPAPAPALPPPLKKTKKIETPSFTETKETKTNEEKTNHLASNETNICGPIETQTEISKEDSVFQQSNFPIDIGTVMAQRLSAMKKLEEDPHNVVALKQMYQAQEMMREWAESKIVPGQFVGSTDAKVLTGEQLNGPFNAWTKKDQFKTAAPIEGGIGMYLLIKMGWNPGQGLGKNNEGLVDPLMPDIKFDKKGLVAEEEQVRTLPAQLVSISKEVGKHPVSMLYELCGKKKWEPPFFEEVFEEGPDHKKNFMFKVNVNGVEYQPSISSCTKKQAKALAASVCLQSFGLLPKDES